MEPEKLTKELLDEIFKLSEYISRYCSRSLNVANALGKPGDKMLGRIIELADQLSDEMEKKGDDC